MNETADDSKRQKFKKGKTKCKSMILTPQTMYYLHTIAGVHESELNNCTATLLQSIARLTN